MFTCVVMGQTANLLFLINIASVSTLILDFKERYSVTPIFFFNSSLLIGQFIIPTSFLFAAIVCAKLDF